MQLIFHEDPGHGWLQVPRRLLEDLGIAERITPYSYQYGDWVFLEEDLDAGTFLEAARAAGIEIEQRRKYEYDTPIRSYPAYRTSSLDN